MSTQRSQTHRAQQQRARVERIQAEEQARVEQQQQAAQQQQRANKQAADDARRSANRERQQQSRAARYSVCKFCGETGHDYIDRKRCHSYCSTCDIIGHSTLTCPVNKQAADDARRSANRERQQKSRAIRDGVCKFCGEEGHNYFDRKSCHFYCSYCDIIDHSTKTCPVKERDEKRSRCINKDAADYKVSTITNSQHALLNNT